MLDVICVEVSVNVSVSTGSVVVDVTVVVVVAMFQQCSAIVNSGQTCGG